MVKSLFPALRGAFASVLLVCNIVFWCVLVFALALVKLLPLQAVRQRVDPMLNALASAWVSCNSLWMRMTQRTEWDVDGVAQLDRMEWYLVNCNHQSWVDILVLQRVFNRRIPLLKFFLKRELIYVPVIGLAWWALDFPFLRRQSKDDLRRNPAQRLADREATLRACERFARLPTSVISFAEGTRFTPAKQQGSPYRHLLKPKAGALALTLGAMGGQFHSMLDVTIVYPAGAPSFWDFLCGRVPRIVVRVRQLPIPPEFSTGDYVQDRAFRRVFHKWLEAIWEHKDAQIDQLLQQVPETPRV
ncbi:MAG: acyltransferase [Burkholderiaceae bacterium]